jgi:hypothetical protein
MTNRIELDLTSDNDARYVVLSTALTEYASTLEFQADSEDESDRYNKVEPTGRSADLRKQAAIARELNEEIESQLDS